MLLLNALLLSLLFLFHLLLLLLSQLPFIHVTKILLFSRLRLLSLYTRHFALIRRHQIDRRIERSHGDLSLILNLVQLLLRQAEYHILRLEIGVNDLAHAMQVVQTD